MDQMKKTMRKANILRMSSNAKMDKSVSKSVKDVMVIKTVLMDQTKKIVNILSHFQMLYT